MPLQFNESPKGRLAQVVAILPGKGKNDFGPEQTVYRTSNRPDDPHVVRANWDTKADLVAGAQSGMFILHIERSSSHD